MNRPWGAIQLATSEYFTEEYLSEARFLGLHRQLGLCLAEPKERTFLEIGPGPGLLTALLRHLGRRVTTVDFAADLVPSVVARLPELPFDSKSFDVALAFQVLEHVPFEMADACLVEMGRLARAKVLISVPDQKMIHDRLYRISVTAGKKEYAKTLYRRPLGRLTNPTEHHWEIGALGITADDVIAVSRRAGLGTERHFFAAPWFHCFVFRASP